MIQNMSVFTCPTCNTSTHIFGAKGVERACANLDIPFLGNIPLDADICTDADRGKPSVVSQPSSAIATSFISLAEQIKLKIGLDAAT